MHDLGSEAQKGPRLGATEAGASKPEGTCLLDDAEAIPFVTAAIVAAREANRKHRQDQDRFHGHKMSARIDPVQPVSDIAMIQRCA